MLYTTLFVTNNYLMHSIKLLVNCKQVSKNLSNIDLQYVDDEISSLWIIRCKSVYAPLIKST